MKALSVMELAELYNINRQSIYKRINKGDLSKNSEGKIDFAEAIRVFGEPSQRNSHVTTLHSPALHTETEVDILKQQLDMLKKQLELAHEREVFQRKQLEAKDNQIESIQRLLEAPKSHISTFSDQNSVPDTLNEDFNSMQKEVHNVESSVQENPRIPVPEHGKPEPEKRSFLSRFFKPYG